MKWKTYVSYEDVTGSGGSCELILLLYEYLILYCHLVLILIHADLLYIGMQCIAFCFLFCVKQVPVVLQITL